MPIFRREAGSPTDSSEASSGARSNPSPVAATTLVAKGSKITGQITGESPIHVAGELDGSIEVDQAVLIASGGLVNGDIQARTIRVGGEVKGDVQAREKVEVTPSGVLHGNIRAPRVILEEGAFFKGQVEMAGDGGAQTGQRKRPPSSARDESEPPKGDPS